MADVPAITVHPTGPDTGAPAPSRPSVVARTATAPISWGICEVPGWGLQLPVQRVLTEMRASGFTATELGSVGYLPTTPGPLLELLDAHGLRLTGGFVPLALHDPDRRAETTEAARTMARLFADAGAFTFVTCAVSDPAHWERPVLDADAWGHLVEMLSLIGDLCADHGLTQVIHPHVDSLIETADDVERLLATSDVAWVLDTGHLAIGGTDPVRFATDHADRVGLVHLKDLRTPVARALRTGDRTLMEAVQAGLFPPLGRGDLDIAAVIAHLERAGYDGWYVIEQDVALASEPPDGEGPLRDVMESVAYLRSVDTALAAPTGGAAVAAAPDPHTTPGGGNPT